MLLVQTLIYFCHRSGPQVDFQKLTSWASPTTLEDYEDLLARFFNTITNIADGDDIVVMVVNVILRIPRTTLADQLTNSEKVPPAAQKHAADDGDDEVRDGQEHHGPLGIYGGEEEDEIIKTKHYK